MRSKGTKIKAAGIAAAAVLLVLAAFFKYGLVGYSFIALVLSAVAAALFLFCVMPHKLRIVLLACIIAFMSVFLWFEALVIRESKGVNGENADFLIVLGAGVHGTTPSRSLSDRLKAAEAYLKANPECIAVLSGGQGSGERISEAEAMRRTLTARGIDENRLIMEDRSTSTIENLQFSMDKITEYLRDRSQKHILPQSLHETSQPVRIVICSSEYHLCRARYTARRLLDMDLGTTPAKTSLPVIRLNNFLREAAGMIAMKFYEMTGRL